MEDCVLFFWIILCCTKDVFKYFSVLSHILPDSKGIMTVSWFFFLLVESLLHHYNCVFVGAPLPRNANQLSNLISTSLSNHELHNRSVPHYKPPDLQQHAVGSENEPQTLFLKSVKSSKQPDLRSNNKKVTKKTGPTDTATVAKFVPHKSTAKTTRVTTKKRSARSEHSKQVTKGASHFISKSDKKNGATLSFHKFGKFQGYRKIKANEEEQFLLGFTEEINELENDEEQTAELSKTLHSPAFYENLNQKKIKVTYNPKELSKGKSKPKYKHGVYSKKRTFDKNATRTIFPIFNSNQFKSRIETGKAVSKQKGKEARSSQSKAMNLNQELVKKAFLDKKVHDAFQKELNVNKNLPQVSSQDIQKRRNISTHNSVQSNANLDGVKLGKRSNINKNLPQVSSQDIQKRRNISIHNSVQSNANLDGVKLGKRSNINKNLPKVSSQDIQKRRNISIHNSVQSNANLDGVKLGKRFNINKNLPQVSSQDIQKRRNISIHNSVQSNANLDGVKLGKRFNINKNLPQVSSQDIQKRRNISIHNSVQSNANLDGVKLGKRFNINKNLPQVSSQDIQKRRNISIHNSVQSNANLDELKLGKRFNINKNLHKLSSQEQRKNISVNNLLKNNTNLNAFPAGKRSNVHVPKSTNLLMNEKPNIGFESNPVSDVVAAERKQQDNSKVLKPFQGNFQEQMEMFNKLEENTFDDSNLEENVGSSSLDQSRMPTLSKHAVTLLSNKTESNVLHYGDKNKQHTSNKSITKKAKVKEVNSKQREGNPTRKSSIGPIGETSRMVGIKAGSSKDQTLTSFQSSQEVYHQSSTPVRNLISSPPNHFNDVVEKDKIRNKLSHARKDVVLLRKFQLSLLTTSSDVKSPIKDNQQQQPKNEIPQYGRPGKQRNQVTKSRQRRQVKLQGENIKQIASKYFIIHFSSK